ncbi:hypothetical protein M3Y99_01507200 [Aphelenchoides fujianensis]|nr:hypothetical protein M3Y99_01507200 [Aphelenchoides fujianensis]
MTSEKGVYSYRTTVHPEAGKADVFGSDDYEYSNDEEYDSREEPPANCPPDEYKDNCPEDCNIIEDSKGCRKCICARKRGPEPNEPTEWVEGEAAGEEPNAPSLLPENVPQQISPIQSRPPSPDCSPEASEGEQACHSNAACEAVNGGRCCKCSSEYFGNGRDCPLLSVPVGSFEAVINGKEVEKTELYAYIDPAAGSQHTAISGLSEELGWSLQLLDSIGNVMAWLFAKVESADVQNGFQYTGGVFNRTLNIHLGEQNVIAIRQEFAGREGDALRVNIFVRGTLPTLESGATVSFTDFDEKFHHEEAGFFRSYADRHLTVRQGEQEVQHRVTVDQQLRFKECPYTNTLLNNATVLHVSRISGVYSTKDRTLRFGSQIALYNPRDADAATERNNNPCLSQYHICNQPNMFCKPEQRQYRCECEPGFQYLQDDTVEPKFRCVDTNECVRSPCDRNADCENTVGSFVCRCRQGFSGDGKQCTRDGDAPQQTENGFECRDHSDCHQWGECSFTGHGQGVCKCRGWYVGDGKTHCGPPAVQSEPERHPIVQPERIRSPDTVCRGDDECGVNSKCVYNGQLNYYRCECQSPYYNNGETQDPANRKLLCDRNAQCVATGGDPPAVCQCRQGWEGNGTFCYAREESAQRLPVDEAHECSDQSNCHPQGHCVYRERDNRYFCECLPGYKGDGWNQCIRSEECDILKPRDCPENSQCQFNGERQTYTCQCHAGYSRQGDRCLPSQTPTAESCNTNPHICHPEASCVHDQANNRWQCVCPAGKFGDGYIGCSSQPPPQPVAACACGPNAECVRHPTHGNFTCICKSGFSGNGFDCQRVSSCYDDPSICSENARCMPDHRGFYVCNCNNGFVGTGFRDQCTPIQQDSVNPLLIARGMSIIHRSANPDAAGRQVIVKPHQVVVDLDYDCITQRIFWSDISGFTIRSAAINGTDIKDVYSDDLRSPEGIAIDWTSRNVYYADSIKDEIGVITLDGRYQKALLTEGLVNPRALAIDIDNRVLYYSDWYRRNPRIGRIDLDGRNNRDFLCWVDAGKKQLSCIRLDGTGRRVVFSPLEYPFGLTHENEERFYWTDWKDHKVHSVSINGDHYRSFAPSVAGQGKIYGILSQNSKCQGTQTECSNQNGGCKYICLPTQHGARCECPDNVADAEC